jgi:hypothetical protein
VTILKNSWQKSILAITLAKYKLESPNWYHFCVLEKFGNSDNFFHFLQVSTPKNKNVWVTGKFWLWLKWPINCYNKPNHESIDKRMTRVFFPFVSNIDQFLKQMRKMLCQLFFLLIQMFRSVVTVSLVVWSTNDIFRWPKRFHFSVYAPS